MALSKQFWKSVGGSQITVWNLAWIPVVSSLLIQDQIRNGHLPFLRTLVGSKHNALDEEEFVRPDVPVWDENKWKDNKGWFDWQNKGEEVSLDLHGRRVWAVSSDCVLGRLWIRMVVSSFIQMDTTANAFMGLGKETGISLTVMVWSHETAKSFRSSVMA